MLIDNQRFNLFSFLILLFNCTTLRQLCLKPLIKMKKILALMCAGALVMGLSTGFNAEAKVKKGRKTHKIEKVTPAKADKDCTKDCEKACENKKAECKDAKACDKMKAECKDAKACDMKKVECKDAKACDMKKAECKDAKACDKKQGFNKQGLKKIEKGDSKLLKKADCKDMKKADCDKCEMKAGHKCERKSPCCEGGECKKNGACGKEKCKAGSKECCD